MTIHLFLNDSCLLVCQDVINKTIQEKLSIIFMPTGLVNCTFTNRTALLLSAVMVFLVQHTTTI